MPVPAPRLRVVPVTKDANATFWFVRAAVSTIGILFPIVLVVVGWARGVAIPNSFSAYYHATAAGVITPPGIVGLGPMRDEFVGLLFAVGICMYIYKGFSELEDWLLNVAGIFAAGIALVPMPWPEGSGSGFSWHYFFAVSFFVLLAIVCTFCSETTLREMPAGTPRSVINKYHAWYWSLSAVMITSPLVALVLNEGKVGGKLVLWMELLGILAFSVYWLVKTYELKRSALEERMLRRAAEKRTAMA